MSEKNKLMCNLKREQVYLENMFLETVDIKYRKRTIFFKIFVYAFKKISRAVSQADLNKRFVTKRKKISVFKVRKESIFNSFQFRGIVVTLNQNRGKS